MDAGGLIDVQRRIAGAARGSGRSTDDIVLVVVSKQRSDAEVMAVFDAGQRIFGENRQQGLQSRLDSDLPGDIEWHFVGPLQSRKVRYVASAAGLLHSLDRLSLADRWVASHGGSALVQFNLAGEPQKSGFDPRDASQVLDDLISRGVDVRGVMAIPPLAANPETSARWFSKLRSIFESYRDTRDSIDVCSMGMSNDFEVAIREGATMIRVGRAIFEATNNGLD
ncbi:MAG: YggS family pyridoxal phosphate-dependent enzyme [Acidimicrobiia bacterium]|nr:MAG: YggS family pyridoxal phosphate-dependent enzyme [Acidimicrobiia bacterium]